MAKTSLLIILTASNAQKLFQHFSNWPLKNINVFGFNKLNTRACASIHRKIVGKIEGNGISTINKRISKGF